MTVGVSDSTGKMIVSIGLGEDLVTVSPLGIDIIV
jgi:hypothetical protein